MARADHNTSFPRWIRAGSGVSVLTTALAMGTAQTDPLHAAGSNSHPLEDTIIVTVETFQIPDRIPNRPAAHAEKVSDSLGILERKNKKIGVYLETLDLPNGAYTMCVAPQPRRWRGFCVVGGWPNRRRWRADTGHHPQGGQRQCHRIHLPGSWSPGRGSSDRWGSGLRAVPRRPISGR